MADPLDSGEELVATIKNAAGIILAVTENRNWIEFSSKATRCTPRPSICRTA
jgi:hypothetical protein